MALGANEKWLPNLFSRKSGLIIQSDKKEGVLVVRRRRDEFVARKRATS